MRRLFLPIVSLLLAAFTGCAEPPPPPPPPDPPPPVAQVATQAPPCSIQMGWDPWEPYQYKDVDGNLRGLDVELVQLIAGTAGCDVNYVEGRWVTLLRQLQEGDVDMLTGASRTPSRESFAWFTEPYRQETFQLFVRREDIDKHSATDLAGLLEGDFRLGITEQFSYGDAVERLQEMPRFADKFVGATIGELNYARLLDLEIDGFLGDPIVVTRAFRLRNMGDQIVPHPIEIHRGNVDLMFSKLSVTEETVARFDEALRTIKADGRHQAVLDKYLN